MYVCVCMYVYIYVYAVSVYIISCRQLQAYGPILPKVKNCRISK